MKFNDDFYRILAQTKETGTAQFRVRIDANHSIFTGHFPDNPVTPGVVQMEMIKELAGIAVGKVLELVSMGNCKFLAILNPNTDPEIEIVLHLSEDEKDLKVTALIQNERTTFLKMNAVYR